MSFIKVHRMLMVSKEDIDDIMCSALEGGVTYWCDRCEVVGEYKGKYASEQISGYGELRFHVIEEFEEGIDTYELNKEKFLKGLQKWIDEEGAYDAIGCDDGQFLYLDTGNIDGNTADSIIQYALFGEIVYA
jgi:hypothetical protein